MESSKPTAPVSILESANSRFKELVQLGWSLSNRLKECGNKLLGSESESDQNKEIEAQESVIQKYIFSINQLENVLNNMRNTIERLEDAI